MRLLVPFVPHLANECLKNLDSNKVNQWPKIKKVIFKDAKTKIIIQTNGKTRDVVELAQDIEEKKIAIFFSSISCANSTTSLVLPFV